LKIFKNEKDLFLHSFKIFKELSIKYIKKNGFFKVALSGGKTPLKLFKILKNHKKDISWDKIFIFFVDERFVPFKDKKNNGYSAYKNFIKPLNLKKENIFYIKTDKTPSKNALEYENTIKKNFKKNIPSFDLIMLGLGEDGHIASLFPKTKALKEKKRLIIETKHKNLSRISFTLKLINSAKNIILIAKGEKKAKIIKEFLKGRKTYPISLVKPKGKFHIFIDKEAASSLINR